MADQLKRHIIARKAQYVLSIVCAVFAVSIYVALVGSFGAAYAAPTGVTIADNDTTGYGLDGRDVTISWTPGSQPAGYQFTKVIFVTSTVNVTAANYDTFFGQVFFDYTVSSVTFTQAMVFDGSMGTLVTSSQYVGWVIVSSTSPSVVSSSAVSLTFDNPSDASKPSIEHIGVHTQVRSQAGYFHAFVQDDQTTLLQFADTTDGGNEYFQMVYSTTSFSTSATVNGTHLGNGLFEFQIPAANIPGTGSYKYYLKARDASNNAVVFCASSSAATASACETSPFIVNVVVAGTTRSVAGTITKLDGSTALSTVFVFAGGSSNQSTSSSESGTYTLSGLKDSNGYDIVAGGLNGYCKSGIFKNINGSNLTSVNINLGTSPCFVAGNGIGFENPMVMFSNPPNGSFGFPIDKSIVVGFNTPLDPAAISIADASIGNPAVYLTSDDGSTKVAGKVFYCATKSSTAECTSALHDGDTNAIVFDPAADLVASKPYILEIGSTIKSVAGISISGNLAGGGHRITFNTFSGVFNEGSTPLGSGAAYMPAYVRSMTPGPGFAAKVNTNVVVEFSEAMDSTAVESSRITLWKIVSGSATQITASVSLDSSQLFVVIDPTSNLSTGEYEVRVKGSVMTQKGITLRPAAQGSENAFSSRFNVESGSDTTAPTMYSQTTDGSTGVAVNSGRFIFGFNEGMSPTTINSSNISLKRGSTAVAAKIKYDAGLNQVTIIPEDVLAPNSQYSAILNRSVTDIAGVALSATQTINFTTGAVDQTQPKITEGRCDDSNCMVRFNEPMNHVGQIDRDNYPFSAINTSSITISVNGGANKMTGSGVTASYDENENMVKVSGLSGMTIGGTYQITVVTARDLSGNSIDTTANFAKGIIEDGKATFGNFGGTGMFGPPVSAVGTSGANATFSEFKPEGFGSFTAAQVFNGETTMVFPFNRTAGVNSNITQIKYRPGAQVQSGDAIEVTFPAGTTFGTVAMDTNSPFRSDANEFGSGIVTVSVSTTDATARTVRLVAAVTGGNTGNNDSFTIDLKGIINPTIPKGPSTGGYTATIKHQRLVLGTLTTQSTKTSLPYFIDTAGANSLDVGVTVVFTPASADGDIKLFGGGNAGAMDKTLTMTNGRISAVDGVATTTVAYRYLPDGCYFFSTEPLITLGGVDYDGKSSGESKCVGTSMGKATTGTVSIVLVDPKTGFSKVATTTVAIGGVNFDGKDVEIFVGGPSKFRTKKLSSVGDLTSSQVTTTIPLTGNGTWFIGVGPAMEHGSTGAYKAPEPLPGMAPAPMEVVVSGFPSNISIKAGSRTPQNVQFNDSTDTITFNFGAAGTTVSGTVQDVSGNRIADAEVFVMQQDFGMPQVKRTNASGTFSISIGNPGSYQFGIRKNGLPSFQSYFELRDSKVYFNGADVTSAGLTIVISKPDYYISGKVLDASDNPITYAPIMAVGSNGTPIPAQTDSSGNYTVFVNNGTYTVRVILPPSTEACGSFSKTVTVSGANMTSQNIEQTETSCVVLSGTITANGVGLPNTPVFIQETTAAGVPVVGGERKGTVTGGTTGAYSLTISPNKVYRLAFWYDSAEKGVSVTMGTENATQNISITSSIVTFIFTGGTTSMNGLIELKDSSDVGRRVSKSVTGLNSIQTVSVESGQTYNYFVDVFGFGKFTGSIVAGAGAVLDVSTSNLITVSGTIKDDSGNALSGALVTFSNSSTLVYETALTDANGNYTATVRANGASDRYLVAASLAGYVQPEASKLVSFTAATDDYDFGGTDSPEHAALAQSSRTISGTITDSNGDEMTEGYVMATNNSTGAVVKAAIEGDGTYSLAVATGTWSVEALGPRHAKTEASSDPAITSADATANITLIAASSRVSTSTVGIVAGNTGGSIDSEETDMKVTAGAGVLQTGSGNVTLNMERSYTAPDSETVRPLANVMYDIEATGNSSIKTLNGSMEIQIDYTDFVSDIPTGINESDLMLMYYSTERGEYIPVEGGYTIDTANNTITGKVAHLTGFSVGAPGGDGVAAASSPSTPSTPNNNNGGGGGGGGGLAPFGSVPPTVVSGTPAMVINGGAATTDKTDVTLSFNVKGAYTMIISNVDNYDGLTYVAYASSTSWKLTEGNGKKTVYARFRSLEGGILPATAQITLGGQATDEPVTTVECALDMGSAYKTADTPAVWYITEDCTKRAFVSAQKFFTYFTSWGEVKVTTKAALDAISNDTLGFMPSGPLYDPKYGALVKIVSDPKVYLLLGNKRHWITSETVFDSLKYAWNWIEDVAVGLLDKYESAGEITYTDHHPNNTIVKYANSPAVYRLEVDGNDEAKQVKRHIKNEKAFEKLGFRWDRIVTIDATEQYEDGAPLE